MGSNSFGSLFRVTTFGESHGIGVGAVIDGCPAGLAITKEEVDAALSVRQPGKNPYTSPRKEPDTVEILSGVFGGVSTGAPITLLIRNHDADSSPYASMQHLYRPGHANFTYLKKYGVFDYRGGGRASARETAARVAAGAVAKKLLLQAGIQCVAFLTELGGIAATDFLLSDLDALKKTTLASPIFCPDPKATNLMTKLLTQVQEEGDSVGGIISCIAHAPVGLGSPVYDKLEAQLASAMLSIPASKGFEIGSGFEAARMRGSTHNDLFDLDDQGNIYTLTNHSGGTLGGISTGNPLFFRVAFKPTSSIKKSQTTISVQQEKTTFAIPSSGRHDPCVAIRAAPVVEAMTALVLADAWLMNQQVRCDQLKATLCNSLGNL